MIAKPSDPTRPAVKGMSEQVGGASAGYKLTPKSWPTRRRQIEGGDAASHVEERMW
jgi:hypothetical protein